MCKKQCHFTYSLCQPEEQLGGGLDEGVGEVVVGVVELGLVLAATDTEHGAGELKEVLGKIFTPAERSLFKVKGER